MSPYVIATPEVLAAASSDLAGIREAIRAATAAAAPVDDVAGTRGAG